MERFGERGTKSTRPGQCHARFDNYVPEKSCSRLWSGKSYSSVWKGHPGSGPEGAWEAEARGTGPSGKWTPGQNSRTRTSLSQVLWYLIANHPFSSFQEHVPHFCLDLPRMALPCHRTLRYLVRRLWLFPQPSCFLSCPFMPMYFLRQEFHVIEFPLLLEIHSSGKELWEALHVFL